MSSVNRFGLQFGPYRVIIKLQSNSKLDYQKAIPEADYNQRIWSIVWFN